MLRAARSAFTLVELLVVVAIVSLLLGLLTAGIWKIREAANRICCCNNLRQIALAYKAHADQTETFPTPVSSTEYGVRLRSSIPPLLPYLGQKAVYAQWNQKADWNDGSNAPFINHILEVLLCPSVTQTPAKVAANTPNQGCAYPHYRSDYGELTNVDSRVWPYVDKVKDYTGLLNHDNKSGFTRADFCSDGLSNTLLLAEDAGRPYRYNYGTLVPDSYTSGAGWASSDLYYVYGNDTPDTRDSIGATNANEVFSFHIGGAHLVFGDGSIRFVPNNIEPRILAAMVTARGGEVFTMPQ